MSKASKPPPAKKRRSQYFDVETDDELEDFLNEFDDSSEEEPYGASDEDDFYDPEGDTDLSY